MDAAEAAGPPLQPLPEQQQPKNQEAIVPLFRCYEDIGHEHNSWDVVRKRNNKTTLRCRECQHQVKIQNFKQCKKFVVGKCVKEDCRSMHVHPQKMNLKERVMMHGEAVLERVPHDSRSGIYDTDGPPTLLDPDELRDRDTDTLTSEALAAAAAAYSLPAAFSLPSATVPLGGAAFPGLGAMALPITASAAPAPPLSYYTVAQTQFLPTFPYQHYPGAPPMHPR